MVVAHSFPSCRRVTTGTRRDVHGSSVIAGGGSGSQMQESELNSAPQHRC